MGTIIDQVSVARGGWRTRHSALRLAVAAAQSCLHEAHCSPNELDLLINAGLYRDKNLGEPALAAMIQEDIGANPEDPHPDAHGTFSFDIANGTCGVLTAMQIVDGFLRSGSVHRAIIVASDADPGAGMSEHFPYSPVGGALLCSWRDDDHGLGPVTWENFPDGGETLRATVGLNHRRNILTISKSASMDQQFAAAAAKVATECLGRSSIDLTDVDLIVAAPARPQFRASLASHLGVSLDRIAVTRDEHTHTAALIAGLDEGTDATSEGRTLLFVVAGAGVTAGAALYRQPAARGSQ